jgi:transcription-repair coupling factor (superfamily II helicase)
MTMPGCSTRRVPSLDRRMLKKPLAAGGTVRSGRYAEGVRRAVGDAVVHPALGAGRVSAREKRVVLGAEHEVVVLALADGLSVTLPMQLARDLLRPLVSEAA